jgi:DNA recombination protein RmuC
MLQEILFVIAGVVMGAVVVFFVLRKRPESGNEGMQHALQLQQMIAQRLDQVSEQMDRRLQENVRAMNESKEFLANRVSSTERTVRAVSNSLGKLEEATAALHRTNQEIASFQHMLRSPKVRGSFGEVMLGNLLADVMPSDRYELQYTFSESGEIADSIIRLQDGYIVAVDAKFPLANYELYARAEEEEERHRLRKDFIRDVKKHISDISRKYISPQAKTLDYAFMYIPIEGVYYETMVHDRDGDTLWEFCLTHKVIPVSPNSFLAYLQTVLVGLRGMKIQQQAKEILESLGQIRRDFGQFGKDFAMIGSHLTNAKNRYDDSARRLDTFSNRLDALETAQPAVEIPEEN